MQFRVQFRMKAENTHNCISPGVRLPRALTRSLVIYFRAIIIYSLAVIITRYLSFDRESSSQTLLTGYNLLRQRRKVSKPQSVSSFYGILNNEASTLLPLPLVISRGIFESSIDIIVVKQSSRARVIETRVNQPHSLSRPHFTCVTSKLGGGGSPPLFHERDTCDWN